MTGSSNAESSLSDRRHVQYSNFMRKMNWWKIVCALVVGALVGGWIGAAGEKVKFVPVAKEVIEARVGKYAKQNQEREATLKQLFSDAGCGGDNLSDQRVKESKLPNVVCKLRGSSDRVIIVGAHYDHVAEGDGVVDNWSGASLLPSLYEAIKDVPREHTFLFIGFTDEEKGEIGSRFYAQHMTKEQVSTTDAMVNLDTLGLAPTEVWKSHSDKLLVRALA